MIVFKPRLAMFYVVVLVIVAILTNKLTVSTQKAVAQPEEISTEKVR